MSQNPSKTTGVVSVDPAREVVVTRTFDAPRELVFEVWTNPRHVEQWWGPMGFTNPVCELDARVDGLIRIDMRAPNGTVYPMTGTYREIIQPERIVFTSAAMDGNGNPIFTVVNTVTLTEKDGKTTLTLHARVVDETADAAQYLKGMNMGWNQSLDRLDSYLKETR